MSHHEEIEQQEQQASLFNEWAKKGYLQPTIDPFDDKGLKCDYINRWSRFYFSVGKYKTFLTAENSFPAQQRRYDDRREEFSWRMNFLSHKHINRKIV